MLVFTCHPQQTLLIGKDVTVTVLKVKSNRVHFAITSPKELPVRREEVYKRIQKESQQLKKSKTTEIKHKGE